MSIKPEAGKAYFTRNRQRTDCLQPNLDPDYPFTGKIGPRILVFTAEGRFAIPKHGGGTDHPLDLVKEIKE